MILQKLVVQLKSIGRQVLNALYTSCRWVAGAKNMFSMSKKSQDSAWKEDGALHPDYILASSATPGVPSTPLERAMKAPIDLDVLRKKGL
jgi:hypothetical protein